MMFSRNRDAELERAKDKAQQEVENDRSKLERERQQLQKEREQLEKLRDEMDAREEKLEELEDQLEDLEDELDDHEEELEDAESVREILDVVSERIPNLMRGINDALATPEAMENMAKSLAVYHRTLIDAGMDQDLASRLTTIQASAMNHMVAGHGLRHIRPASPTPPKPPVGPHDDFRTANAGE